MLNQGQTVIVLSVRFPGETETIEFELDGNPSGTRGQVMRRRVVLID